MNRRAIAIALFTLLFTGLAVLAVLPFTSTGAQLAANAARWVPGLQVEYGGGNLAKGIRLTSIEWRGPGLTVTLDDVVLELDTQCLWRSEFCVDSLSTRSLQLVITDSENQDTGPVTPLSLPYAVIAEKLAIKHLLIDWPGGNLRAGPVTGQGRWHGDTLNLSALDIAGSHVALTADTQTSDGGNWQENLQSLPLPFILQLPAVRIVDAAVTTPAQQIPLWSLSGGVTASADHVAVEQLRIDSDSWGVVSITGEFRAGRSPRLDAQLELTTEQPPAAALLHHGQGSLALRGPLDRLETAGYFCGFVAVGFQGQVDLLQDHLPFAADITGQCGGEPATAPTAVQISTLPGLEDLPAVTVAPDWAVSVRGDQRQQFAAIEATLSAPDLAAQTVAIEARHEAGFAEFSSVRISPADGAGELRGQGSVTPVDQGHEWRAQLQSDNYPLPALTGPLQGVVNGEANLLAQARIDGDWQVFLRDIDLRGEVNALPAEVQGELSLRAGRDLSGTDINFDVNGATGSVRAVAGAPPRGNLSLRDLSLWLADAQGEAVIQWEWVDATESVTFKGQGSGLGFGALTTDSSTLAGQLAMGAERPFDLSATVRSLRYEAFEQKELALDISGNTDVQRIAVRTEGDISTAVVVSGEPTDGGWAGELQPMNLRGPAGNWRLGESVLVELDRQQQSVSLADHCWQRAGTELCFADLLFGPTGGASAVLRGDLNDLRGWLPKEFTVEGAAQATVATRWQDWRPESVLAKVEVGAGSLAETLADGETAQLDWDKILLSYDGDDQDGNLLGELTMNDKAVVTIDAQTSTASRAAAGLINISDLQLRLVRPFIPVLDELGGVVNGRLTLSGDLDSPQIRGPLQLSNGVAALVDNPTRIDDADLILEFRGREADLRGQLVVGEGSSEIDGTLQLPPQPRLQAKIRGTAKTLMLPPATTIAVAEDLNLLWDADQLAITGSLQVPSAEIVVDQLPPSSIAVSDDVVRVDVSDEAAAGGASSQVRLDLAVTIDNAAHITGQGFDARVGGKLHLRQQAREPLSLYGNLRLARGRVEAMGQPLELRRGTVSFVGPPDNPQLDLEAEREITEDQVTAGMRIGGSLDLPQLEFYSRPPMPQAQIMAYLLGSKGIGRDGGSASVATALALNSALPRSSGPLSKVDFGLQGHEESTRAEIGGRIGDRLYLSYGLGLYEPVNTLTVRLDLLRNLWLEVVSGLQQSADLYYSWEQR